MAGLQESSVAARLPAKDLERARRWYSEVLALEPVEVRPGGLRYEVRGQEFCLFESGGGADGSFTQLAFTVDDLDAVVADLCARGVVFQEYDVPGFATVGGIVEIDDNDPSKGVGERAAWFLDSEGNMLALGSPIPA